MTDVMDPLEDSAGSATASNDDGLLLIVVGDADENLGIKIESSAGDAEMVTETLEEEYIDDDVKNEVKTEYDPDEDIKQSIKIESSAGDAEIVTETLEEEYINDDENEYDPDDTDITFLPDQSDDTLDEEMLDFEEFGRVIELVKSRKKKHPPKEQKSYVNNLRLQNPELHDSELLIETLSQIMANLKCPAPPTSFAIKKDSKFECRNCGLKKDTKMALARHWQDRHGPRYLFCYACGADFRSLSNLYKHEKRCDSADIKFVLKARGLISKFKGTCPGRPFLLPDEHKVNKTPFISSLRQTHPELEHNREQLIKMLCDKMAEEIPPNPPQDSIIYIDDENINQCTACGLKDVTYNVVRRHWQWRHGPCYLSCYACGTQYRDSRNLYKHEKRCTKPDACVMLEARARMAYVRRGAPAAARQTYRRPAHYMQKEEKQDNVYACKECPAVFHSSKSLLTHKLMHSGLRPYCCDLCPAQYTSSSVLSKHKQLHKNETYICSQCGDTFKSKDHLRSHLDKHLPVPKFACPHCKKRYAKKWTMQIHIDRDHLKLPARCACQICPKRYPRMSLLKDHMLQKHGLIIITRQMFLRNRQNFTDTQLKNAKIVKKTDLNTSDQPLEISNDSSGNEEGTNRALNNEEESRVMDDDDVIFVEGNSTETQCNEDDEQKSQDQPLATQTTQNKQISLELRKCPEKQSRDGIVQQKISETEKLENNDNSGTQSEEQDGTSKDLLEYAKQIQQGETSSTKPLIIIKDGQAVFMDKNNVGFYKQQLKEVKNSKVDQFIENLKTDVERITRSKPTPPELLTTNNPNNLMLQEEVISETSRVVTMKNCVSSEEPQVYQKPKIQIGKHRKNRKQYLK